MKDITQYTGQQYGYLLILDTYRKSYNGKQCIFAKAQCVCGKIIIISLHALLSGHSKSCGCMRDKLAAQSIATHGGCKTRIYSIWMNMRMRCTNPNHTSYKHYGGRGITVCDEWLHSFEKFKDWTNSSNYRETLTLERIDVNKGYSPANCTWVSEADQRRNTTKTPRVCIGDVYVTLREWCQQKNIPYLLAYRRLKRGWDLQRIENTPNTREAHNE